MTCEQDNLGIVIIQGGEIAFIVRLINSNTMDPVDLTSADHITTCFYNEDGTELNLDVGSGVTVVGPPTIGKLQIGLTAAQAALLNPVNNATLEIAVDFGSGNPTKCQIVNAYSVLESVC